VLSASACICGGVIGFPIFSLRNNCMVVNTFSSSQRTDGDTNILGSFLGFVTLMMIDFETDVNKTFVVNIGCAALWTKHQFF